MARRKASITSHPVANGHGRDSSWDTDEDEHKAAEAAPLQHVNGDGEKAGYAKQEKMSLNKEVGNLVLLMTLYALQGVPLGLTMGSMPFLLQSTASYTQIGIFTVASYPYSLKLLWSPLVDSVYYAAFGRRKSWIVPMQLLSGGLMLLSADWLEQQLKEANIMAITSLFLVAVMLAATQDIAVDGWALTLLPKEHVGWASTCQTVGMNIGYFASFTVFLALNDPAFCNQYLRDAPMDEGVVSLSSYVRFWGWVYVVVTLMIAVLKVENPAQQHKCRVARAAKQNGCHPAQGAEGGEEEGESFGSVGEAYAALWGVVRLPAVRRLAAMLLTCRVGMLAAEMASPLKLLEKGVTKEALAGLVLIEFPVELLSAVVAGRWSAGSRASRPWVTGYRVRLVAAGALTALVAAFPQGTACTLSSHPRLFLLLGTLGLLTSFTATLMFTALGSFFTRISDPSMGGAYLTLLNTITNMGVMLPKIAVFWLMDVLTQYRCSTAPGGDPLPDLACPDNRAAARGDNECTLAGGTCEVSKDGFYMLSYVCIAVGLLLSLWYQSEFPRLEALPPESWRAQRQPAGSSAPEKRQQKKKQ